MISRKFSLDLDQAEIASSIRLEVTAKNVKRYPTRKCRKNGQFLFTLLCSDAGVYFLYLQLSSQFFFCYLSCPERSSFHSLQKGLLVADEAHATTGTRHFDRWTEKNRVEGVQTSHVILPRGLVRIDAGKNASCNRPTGRAYEVLRVVFTCFCTVLVNK